MTSAASGGRIAETDRMHRKRRAFRVSAKFYILIAVICAGAAGAWYFITGNDSAQAQQGSIDFSMETAAVVVRDEEVVVAETYGRADYLVPDKQRVEAGTPVLEIYRWGYNDKVMVDLVDVRTKILQYEATLLDSNTAEIAALDDEITEKTKQIRDAAEGTQAEQSDIAALESDLTDLLDERAQSLRQRVDDDQQLEDYRKQEQQLEERISSWRDVWQTSEAGVVSYYIDGFEQVLNADNIRSASASQVRSILSGTLPMAQTAPGTESLYRLVNNFQWYIVIPTDGPVLEFANDNTFSVVFEDYPDRQYEGTVIGHITEGNDSLYVLEFSEDIGALVDTRRATVRVTTTFSGIEVPEDTLKQENGQSGVYVKQGEQRTFVPVTVRAVDHGRAIVAPVDGGPALQVGEKLDR